MTHDEFRELAESGTLDESLGRFGITVPERPIGDEALRGLLLQIEEHLDEFDEVDSEWIVSHVRFWLGSGALRPN